jgi:hypothetical protein
LMTRLYRLGASERDPSPPLRNGDVMPSLAWRKRRAFDFFRRHRQPGMGSDPIGSIFLGDKFSKVVHGTIRPYYLHAPDVAFAHRQ